MYRSLRVCVVVPAYREERLIGRTLRGIPPWVDRIVVVDDASDDGTEQAAWAVAGEDPRIDVVRLSVNAGVGAAILTGYCHAAALGADVGVVMAGDDQMDPNDLTDLLDALCDERADYVKGNRLAHPEARRMPRLRRFGTHALARMTAWVGGLGSLDDMQCGYTALRLTWLERLPLHEIYPRYGYPNDLILRLAEAGARIVEVPVRPVYADEVSGLAPHRVVTPILTILLQGALRRLERHDA